MIQQLMQRLQQMDDEEAEKMLERLEANIDDEQKARAFQQFLNYKIAPHLVDIRQRSQTDPDPEQVRQRYKQLSEEQQQQLFDETFDDVLTCAKAIRHRPKVGFPMLKSMLRDPATMEALLLIFENEHIDEGYRDQLKKFAELRLNEIGVMALPEMYTENEARPVLEAHDPNTQTQRDPRQDQGD